MSLLSVMSRVALGVPFIYLGYQAVTEPGGRVQLAARFGIPEQYSDVAVRANGGVMMLGGAALVTGLLPRLGAAAVAAAMVPTTLAGHAFWNDSDPQAQAANRTQFLKNLGLIGGLLAVTSRPGTTESDEHQTAPLSAGRTTFDKRWAPSLSTGSRM